MAIEADGALLLIDVQNDFCPGGSLAVPQGDAVVGPLNRAIAAFQRAHRPVLASRDWHPAQTSHFQAWGGKWPPHCVQNSSGAAFHHDLKLPPDAVVFSKGTTPDADSYSTFEGHDGGGHGLTQWLREHGIHTLFVGGLATDYCVLASVLDARAGGFRVSLIQDGVRGVEIQPGDSERALQAMAAAGVELVDSSAL